MTDETLIADLYVDNLGWFRFTTKSVYRMTKIQDELTLEEIGYDTAMLIARELDGLMEVMKKLSNGWMC